MSAFDDREKAEEARFKHDQDLTFKIRNRRNKLFGLWLAQAHLGKSGDGAAEYAKEVVMSDFDTPGDDDIFAKVKADLTAASIDLSDHILTAKLSELEQQAREQVMSE